MGSCSNTTSMWVYLWAELTAGTSMSQRMMGGAGGGAKLLTCVSAPMQLLTPEPGDEIHMNDTLRYFYCFVIEAYEV